MSQPRSIALNAVVISLLCTLGGCNSDEPTFEQKTGDYELQLAVAKARKSLGQFTQALQSPGPNQTSFAVKVRLKADDGQFEAFWMTDVSFDGAEFEGTIANEPIHIVYLSKGQRFTALKADVVDWSYEEAGRRVGGLTDAVLNQRTEESPD